MPFPILLFTISKNNLARHELQSCISVSGSSRGGELEFNQGAAVQVGLLPIHTWKGITVSNSVYFLVPARVNQLIPCMHQLYFNQFCCSMCLILHKCFTGVFKEFILHSVHPLLIHLDALCDQVCLTQATTNLFLTKRYL